MSVGQLVTVTGTVAEFDGLTELTSATTTVLGDAESMPSAATIEFPVTAVGALEAFEGMLGPIPRSWSSREYFNYDRFGEIVLALPLSGEPRPFSGTALDEPGAAANARTLANSLRRITLDDAQSTQNPPVLRHPNGDVFTLDQPVPRRRPRRERGSACSASTSACTGSSRPVPPTTPRPTTGPSRPRARRRHRPRRGDEHAQLLPDPRHDGQ